MFSNQDGEQQCRIHVAGEYPWGGPLTRYRFGRLSNDNLCRARNFVSAFNDFTVIEESGTVVLAKVASRTYLHVV